MQFVMDKSKSKNPATLYTMLFEMQATTKNENPV